MKTFREAFEAGEFLITAEAGPPKGTDVEEMLHHARGLKGKIHAINVTDNQSSVMRLGSLAGSYLLLKEGLDPIFQITCRDRNRLAIQSDLLSAHVFGIRNVLSLTGDHVLSGDHPEAKPVFDIDSSQLLQIIERLNRGRDMSTKGPRGKVLEDGIELKGKTNLFPGSTVTPEALPIAPQLIKFEKKVKAGAKFFQTQAVYNVNKFKSFMETARQYNVKILAGILLLKSAGMARYLNNFVPGISVPEEFIKELEGSSDPLKTGIQIAGRLIKDIKPYCDGVHIMAIGAEDKVLDIMSEAGL
ncbi:MAG: methylenetetrahydrofolate reductase [Candidatus Firestonebacteria bacterium]|nr:methylenetetrahydrofolate reductase [Candidatus Firestonebacteria bacterium]